MNLKRLLSFGLITLFSVILFTNIKIGRNTQSFINTSIDQVSPHEYLMVFGTSKIGRNGKKNAYFHHRILAVLEIYKTKKAKYIILSGDHQGDSYSEVRDMKNELLIAGVPDSAIIIDPKGFDTFQSVENLKEVVKGKEVLLISQKFQVQRALFIAQHLGISASGYCAEEVNKAFGFLTSLREHFARLKMWKDLYF